MDYKDPVFKIIINTKVFKNSVYKLRKKAISLRWLFSTLVKPRYIDNLL
jgi:hypothetical protein